MPVVDRNLRQVATYWAPVPAVPPGAGPSAYAEPVPCLCYWPDVEGIRFGGGGREPDEGTQVIVSIDVAKDGFLLLGESDEEDPRGVSGARPIVGVQRFPRLSDPEQVVVAANLA